MNKIISILAVGLALSMNAQAEDLTANITIKDHKFYPSTIKVPTGQRIKLVFTNTDKTPEEVESNVMGFEKIVAGGGRVTVFVKPLTAGKYNFFGEFNLATAQGYLIAQ